MNYVLFGNYKSCDEVTPFITNVLSLVLYYLECPNTNKKTLFKSNVKHIPLQEMENFSQKIFSKLQLFSKNTSFYSPVL